MFERGKVVLVPFPFADKTAHKVRPAVIISQPKYSLDVVILAFISSTLPTQVTKTDIILDAKKEPNFSKTGLKVTSIIRCHKLATLDRNLILGEIGTLSRLQLTKVTKALQIVLGLK